MAGSPTCSPRVVLTCAYNRRRNRVSPHFETDGTIYMMNTQNTTPSKSKLSSGKPPRGDFSKLSSLATSSENSQEWAEKRCCDDEITSKASSVDSSDEHCREDDASASIFREMADYDDQDDMLVLKRANPVYDSDDEDYMAAPAKRQRTTTSSSSSSMVLSWSSQVSSDPSGGFSIRLQHH